MIEANNEVRTPASPLRVGLIADADDAPRYAEAVRACASLELCAQAGMSQPAALPDVAWFDDTRVLIAQGDIDALLLATSPRMGAKLGELAMAHGVHVWRPPPLSRNFAEAIEVVRRLRDTEVVYHVSSWWDHVGEEVGQALDLEADYEPVFSELHVSATGPSLKSWRSSRVDAGGGVLTYDTYAMLEALTAIRGLPESVAGAIGKCRRRRSEAPRETEDVVSAVFRYEGRGLAHVRASWDIPPFGRATSHHGREATVRYTESSIAVLESDSSVLKERPLPARFLTTDLMRFAAAIAEKAQRGAAQASINRHLAVSAVLEATYLSSRTEQPEIPRRLFEVQRWPEPTR